MRVWLSRFLVIVLIPCLLQDSALALRSPPSPISNNSNVLSKNDSFTRQAVMAPVEMTERPIYHGTAARLRRLGAWFVNRRGSSSFSEKREYLIVAGILLAYILPLALATFGLRGWVGHHPAFLLPEQIILGIPGAVISCAVGYRLETRLIHPYRASIDLLRVKGFIKESYSFGVPIARNLFYGWLLLKIPGFLGMSAPFSRALLNTLVIGPLILAPLSFYIKARLLGRKGSLDAAQEAKDSIRKTFSAQTLLWFIVIMVATSMRDDLSNFAVVTVVVDHDRAYRDLQLIFGFPGALRRLQTLGKN